LQKDTVWILHSKERSWIHFKRETHSPGSEHLQACEEQSLSNFLYSNVYTR